MGDDDDREGEDADGEEEFEKVTDEMMADANDVLEENIRENSIDAAKADGFKKGFLIERSPNAIEVEMKKLEEAKKRNGVNARDSFLEREIYSVAVRPRRTKILAFVRSRVARGASTPTSSTFTRTNPRRKESRG